MARFLSKLGRKLLKTIVCDNGPEQTCKSMFYRARERRVKLHLIQPGKPTRNTFVESFNGRFREGCLNQHWFQSLHMLEPKSMLGVGITTRKDRTVPCIS